MREDTNQRSHFSRSYVTKIANRFKREITVTLYEIIKESHRYKQIDNITGQIFREYHNRALVELIQNAHDASKNTPIKIVLDERDDANNRLLVANKGLPFEDQNFLSITEISLSDKQDVDQMIGNKGVGFRSVLQICSSPIVYSRNADPSKRSLEPIFDGYCFRFSPHSREIVYNVVMDELQREKPGPNDRLSELFGEPIWVFTADEAYIIREMREKLDRNEVDIEKELRSLSPYALPMPHFQAELDQVINELVADGYVTVICLKLDDRKALSETKSMIEAIDKDCLLFTPKANELIIEHRGFTPGEDLSAVMLYDPKFHHETSQYRTVTFLGTSPRQPDDTKERTFQWKVLSGEVAGDELKPFIKTLPDSWHSMQKATVSVAVPLSKTCQDDGVISIFLPTNQSTRCAVSINAPFYGDMARTEVNFENEYNMLLLKKAAGLVIELFLKLIKGEQTNKVAALDLLMSHRFPPLKGHLKDAIKQHCPDLENIQFIPLLLPDETHRTEYGTIGSIRILSDTTCHLLREFSVITRASFAEIGKSLFDDSTYPDRVKHLKEICDWREIAAEIDNETLALWIEEIALSLKKSRATIPTWQKFYEEVVALDFPKRIIDGKALLLSHNYNLVSNCHETIIVFAPPVLSADESEDDPVLDVDHRLTPPEVLEKRIAYFHPDIELRETEDRRALNKLGQYLRDRRWLLREFRPRTIIQQVLIPALHELDFKTQGSTCRDVLVWLFRLVAGMRSREDLEAVDLSEMPVPCKGGWYSAKEAYFSQGWPVDEAELLENCFENGGEIRDRLLWPPQQFFETIELQADHASLLKWSDFLSIICRVNRFPRIVATAYSKDTRELLQLGGSGQSYNVSELQNIYHVPAEVWNMFIQGLQSLSPPIRSYETYYLKRMEIIEGFLECTQSSLKDLAQLICMGWEAVYANFLNVEFHREGSGYKPEGKADSLMYQALKSFPWLPNTSVEPYDEVLSRAKPDQVWFIPAGDLQFRNRSFFTSRFVPHIAAEITDYIPDSMLSFLALKTIPTRSLEDSLLLLLHLVEVWPRVRPEHRNHFVSLWRETIDRAMDSWNSRGRPRISTKINGYLVQKPNHRSESLLHFEEERSSKVDIWFPDDESREKMVGLNLNVVRVEKKRKLTLFREFLQQILPETVKLHNLSETKVDVSHEEGEAVLYEEALPFWEQFPNLSRMILAVFGIGRGDKMDLEGREFQAFVKRLKLLRYTISQNFRVRFHLAAIDRTINPESFLWSHQEGDILIVDEDKLDGWEDLSQAFQLVAGVLNLEPYLAAAFAQMEYRGVVQDVTVEDALSALAKREIDDQEFERVRRAVSTGGEIYVQHTILGVSALSGRPLSEVQDVVLNALDLNKAEGAFIQHVVEKLRMEEIDPDVLHEVIQHSFSDDDLGYGIWKYFGVGLVEFNSVRAQAGLKPCPIGRDFQERKEEVFENEKIIVLFALKPLLRKVATKSGKVNQYLGWCDNWKNKSFIEAFPEHNYWTLERSHVLDYVQTCWEQLEIPMATELETFVSHLADHIGNDLLLREKGDEFGLDYGFPEEELRETGLAVMDSESKALQVRLLGFALKNFSRDIFSKIADLLSQKPFPEPGARRALISTAALGLLSSDVIERKWVEHIGMCGIWDLLDLEIPSPSVVPSQLRLLEDSWLEQAKVEKKKWQDKKLVKSKTIRIGDSEVSLSQHEPSFDAEATDAVENTLVPLLPDSDMDPTKKTRLVKPKERTKGKPKPKKKPTNRRERMTKWDKVVIGALGEFLFFRWLRGKYGEKAGFESWVSRNKERFFPSENGDDRLGYDFEFPHLDRQLQVEVKSSSGADPVFEMGSSEITAAKKALRKKSVSYICCYITNVLNAPKFHFLGNPFLPSNRKNFIFDESSLRLRFRLPKETA